MAHKRKSEGVGILAKHERVLRYKQVFGSENEWQERATVRSMHTCVVPTHANCTIPAERPTTTTLAIDVTQQRSNIDEQGPIHNDIAVLMAASQSQEGTGTPQALPHAEAGRTVETRTAEEVGMDWSANGPVDRPAITIVTATRNLSPNILRVTELTHI